MPSVLVIRLNQDYNFPESYNFPVSPERDLPFILIAIYLVRAEMWTPDSC